MLGMTFYTDMTKKILLALIIGAMVAFALWALATGPSLFEIIDNPKY